MLKFYAISDKTAKDFSGLHPVHMQYQFAVSLCMGILVEIRTLRKSLMQLALIYSHQHYTVVVW